MSLRGLLSVACAVGVITLVAFGPALTALHAQSGVTSSALATRMNLPHGIAGDGELIFVTEPLNGRIAIIDRDSGQEIGELPPPPGGFLLPFEMRLPHQGSLVVLDAGGFPSPTALAIPRIYEYGYHYNPAQKTLSATITRTVRFDGIPIIFSEDIEIVGNGRYVVSDSGFGSLWVVERDGSIRPGIVPASLNPQDAIPALGACPFNATVDTVGGVPFELPGGFAPGVGSMASDGEHLYFSGTCSGGVSRVPLRVFDDARPPHLRAVDIAVVSPRPDPGDFDTLKGLTFNKWGNDGSLYAADPFHLRLVRIDVETGQRTVIADDPLLFNFPVSVKFLQPRDGNRNTLIVSSDQEHRFAALNAALGGISIFQLPFVLTEVHID